MLTFARWTCFGTIVGVVHRMRVGSCNNIGGKLNMHVTIGYMQDPYIESYKHRSVQSGLYVGRLQIKESEWKLFPSTQFFFDQM